VSCLQHAAQIRSKIRQEKQARDGTYQKYDVSFDKVGGRNAAEGPITHDTAGWRNHGEEGCKDGLRLLQLVELDERVEKRDYDENATEISVLYVILRADQRRHMHKVEKRVKGSRESQCQEGCTPECQKRSG